MKSKVIVCEDDPLLQNFYKIILSSQGYDVLVSENGDEIVEELSKNRVSLIVMDINLRNTYLQGNKTNGLKLSRYIKETYFVSEVPVIISTAYAANEEQDSFLKESLADEIIYKPISDFRAFLQTVKFWID